MWAVEEEGHKKTSLSGWFKRLEGGLGYSSAGLNLPRKYFSTYSSISFRRS